MDSIDRTATPAMRLRSRTRRALLALAAAGALAVPAVLLGRMGVAEQEQGKGISRMLVATACQLALDAIDACGGNVNRAAGLLEVAPSTLYRKLTQWREQRA